MNRYSVCQRFSRKVFEALLPRLSAELSANRFLVFQTGFAAGKFGNTKEGQLWDKDGLPNALSYDLFHRLKAVAAQNPPVIKDGLEVYGRVVIPKGQHVYRLVRLREPQFEREESFKPTIVFVIHVS